MKSLFKITVICSIFMMVVGCNEGPAERKGRKIDQKVEAVKDKIQNKGPAQKVGEKLDDMAD